MKSKSHPSTVGAPGESLRRGPSLAALAALGTLALCLWFNMELASALLRAVLVYLGLSLVSLLYRVILGHYLAASQRRAQEEMLQRLQREAEEEARKSAPAAAHPSTPKSRREADAPAAAARVAKPAAVPEKKPAPKTTSEEVA
jgi:hypothetical protein